MKFNIRFDNENTYIDAIPENDNENFGLRAQGPYSKLNLINKTLIINYIPEKQLHPDIIGALCLTAFYPFIKYSATMPFPVSKTFTEGLNMELLAQHDLIDGVYKAIKPIIITNIDANLEIYKSGTNTVIAYGGGMDSTAIACLFPEFILTHTSNINESQANKNVMKNFVMRNLTNKSYIVDSNCTQLTTPGGFTTFTNIFLVPLLLTSDLSIKNICYGEILESACLMNGKKYFPQFNPKSRNKWIRFYNKIGLNIFSPTAGCSELITSKILDEFNLANKVLYCEQDNGKPCHKCTKCLRKVLELNYHGNNLSYEKFNKDNITSFLKTRPLYFSNVFIETIKNNKLPEYIKSSINDLQHINTQYFNKIYSKSFIYFPEDIKEMLIERLSKYADIMSEDENKYLESWNFM